MGNSKQSDLDWRIPELVAKMASRVRVSQSDSISMILPTLSGCLEVLDSQLRVSPVSIPCLWNLARFSRYSSPHISLVALGLCQRADSALIVLQH